MKTLFTVLILLVAGPLWAAPSLQVLEERAERFRELGLAGLQREQYAFIQRLYPAERSVGKALAALSQSESRVHLNNAINARRHGALKLALFELERAMKANPSDTKLKKMHSDITIELTLRQALNKRVASDYLLALSHYEAGRTDRALENFVKVLNMAPHHAGAKRYVERIGEKMGVGQNK